MPEDVVEIELGHRLWASPELPPITYAPDDEPCAVTREGDGISIVGPVDRAGLVNRLSASSSVVIWPYTDLADLRVTWDHTGLLVGAEPGPPFARCGRSMSVMMSRLRRVG